jgi:hypothetical protein
MLMWRISSKTLLRLKSVRTPYGFYGSRYMNHPDGMTAGGRCSMSSKKSWPFMGTQWLVGSCRPGIFWVMTFFNILHIKRNTGRYRDLQEILMTSALRIKNTSP